MWTCRRALPALPAAILMVVGFAALQTACGDGTSSASPAGLGEPCSENADCASGLCEGDVCADGDAMESSEPPGLQPDASSTGRPDSTIDTTGETGGLGDPCTSDDDCLSSICLRVPGGGRQCTVFCDDDTPCEAIDWRCTTIRDSSADVIQICYPDEDTLCQPCGLDSQCGALTDLCLELQDGTFCGTDCAGDGRCPVGYDCELLEAGVEQCTPIEGICGECRGVDFSSSVEHCGGCNQPCELANAAARCSFGLCTIAGCDEGFRSCDNLDDTGCKTSVLVDPANCGGCGVQCDAGDTCRDGACVLDTCPEGTASCDDDEGTGCETSIDDDADNCGICGRTCGEDQACRDGECVLDTCPEGTASCDDDEDTGCETSIDEDTDNCGICDHTCPEGPRSQATCTDGECGITCDDGFGNCDDDATTGCEVNLRLDEDHCGTCENACDGELVCESGECVLSDCPAGRASCDGDDETGCEVDLRTDPDHCGECDDACPDGATCDNGDCACPNGQIVCEDACVTPNACGGCASLGDAPEAPCGDCGTFACDGVDALTCADPGQNSCGGCAALDQEPEGSCGYCDTGSRTCDGQNAVTCTGESSPQSDDNNCGTCLNACDNGTTCVGGACTCPANDVVLTAQPENRAVCAGEGATFQVQAEGSGLTYQWQFSTDGGDTWSNLSNQSPWSGATSATLSLSEASAALDGYRLRARVSGACRTVSSNAARLDVNPAPSSVSASASPNPICAGQTLSLSGGGTNVSTWSWSGPGGFSSSSRDASVSSISASRAGTYTLTGTNACGSDDASTDPVIVRASTAIDTQPQNRSVCPASGTTFSVAASGNGLSYQWQRSTNGGGSWSNLSNGSGFSGATTATLSLSGVQASQNGHQFRVRVVGDCGTVTSNSATLTILAPTSISAHPQNRDAGSGMDVTFSVTAAGAGLSYRWQVSTNAGATWNNLNNGAPYSGVTTSTLTITSVPGGFHDNRYRARVFGSCGDASSNAATLRVISPLNECGGEEPLVNRPGDPCGTCGLYACDGPDNVTCEGSTDTQTDPNNCGTCGNDCEDNFSCLGGSCICGFEFCTLDQICCQCSDHVPISLHEFRCAETTTQCATICGLDIE